MIDFNVYPNQSAVIKIINQLCKNHSSINLFSIGKSHCERDINVLQIGNPKNSPLLCAGFHGTEYLTTLTLLKFVNDFCIDFKPNPSFSKGLTVVPCVNPDGVEIALNGSRSALDYKSLVDSICTDTTHWQSNAAGVDLNHNFDADWHRLKQLELSLDINSPSSTRFGGYSPHSEPEVKALIKLCKDTDFSFAIALHSQGREIYYDFGSSTPPECRLLANIFAKNSGYVLSTPEKLATGGGFKDWVIQKLHKPALTIEMGVGTNPLPLADLENEYKLLYPAFCELLKAKLNVQNKNE